MLDWAKVRGLREGQNPAQWRGHLNHLLPARAKVRRIRHHPALPYGELPTFMSELRCDSSISARALEFVILTAARTGEGRGARWDEIDLKQCIWIVPDERMKSGQETAYRCRRAPWRSSRRWWRSDKASSYLPA